MPVHRYSRFKSMVVYLNGTLEGLVRMCTAVAGYRDRAGVVASTRFAAGYGVCLLSHVLGPYERGCSDGRPQKSPRHWFPCHVAIPFGPMRVHGVFNLSRPTTASSQCRELAYDTTDASGVLRLGDVPNGIVPLLKEATSHKLGRCEFRVESERSRRGGTP